MRRPGLPYQVLEKTPGDLGSGSGAEPRTCTLLSIRREGELWHQQEAAVDILQGEVHPSLLIRENPVSEQSLQQTVRGRDIVPLAHTDEGEDTALDLPYDFTVYADVRAGNALDEADHDEVLVCIPRQDGIWEHESVRFGAILRGVGNEDGSVWSTFGLDCRGAGLCFIRKHHCVGAGAAGARRC